jgi:hypothetical protein
MKKWLLRLIYAALVLMPIGAIADYTATQGAGSTVFAFVCSTTKICPATVLIDSSNVEKATAANPLRTDPVGTTTQPVSATALPLPAGAATAANQATAATSANQTSQITQETAIAGGIGTTADAPCTLPATTTPCTQTAIQKAFANAANSPTPLGSASGGISTKTLAALTSTAIAVKAAAGQVYSGQCSNADATHWAYLQIFNVAAASVTMGTTAPTKFVGIPPASNAGFAYSLVGLQYSTAISAGAASTSTGGTAPTTTLDCTVDYN